MSPLYRELPLFIFRAMKQGTPVCIFKTYKLLCKITKFNKSFTVDKKKWNENMHLQGIADWSSPSSHIFKQTSYEWKMAILMEICNR